MEADEAIRNQKWNDLIEQCQKRQEEEKMQVKITYGRQHIFWGTLFDFIMVLLTCGLWFIWIIIRYLRSH